MFTRNVIVSTLACALFAAVGAMDASAAPAKAMTPQQMKIYLSNPAFPKAVVGLTGSQAQVDEGVSRVRQTEVLLALIVQYPEIQTAEWKNRVVEFMTPSDEEFDEPGRFAEIVRELPLIPDGFVMNSPKELIFFEVEITSPMSESKLHQYGKFAIDIANFDIGFSVLVVNKYGHINEVDLLPHYAAWLATGRQNS